MTSSRGTATKLESAVNGMSRCKPVLPAEQATPVEVQQFLFELLTHNRNLDETHAHRIANCWTLGTGRELRQYQTRMYRHIFGLEEGWIVFKDVKVLVRMEERENLKKQPRDHSLLYGTTSCGAILCASLWLSITRYSPDEKEQSILCVCAIVLATFSGVPFIGMGFALMVPQIPPVDVGTAVDTDLRTVYWKTDEQYSKTS